MSEQHLWWYRFTPGDPDRTSSREGIIRATREQVAAFLAVYVGRHPTLDVRLVPAVEVAGVLADLEWDAREAALEWHAEVDQSDPCVGSESD